MPIKIPSFADALPLTLGEKRPAPNSIKPSEEWDLIRSDSRGALWKNCATGKLQFIPPLPVKEPVNPFNSDAVKALEKEYLSTEYMRSIDGILYPCDADGWIPHTPGDPVPCDGDLKVTLHLRDGSHTFKEKGCPANQLNWKVMPSFPENEILAWKPLL